MSLLEVILDGSSEEIIGIDQWVSKCSPHTNNISITYNLVRNASYLSSPTWALLNLKLIEVGSPAIWYTSWGTPAIEKHLTKKDVPLGRLWTCCNLWLWFLPLQNVSRVKNDFNMFKSFEANHLLRINPSWHCHMTSSDIIWSLPRYLPTKLYQWFSLISIKKHLPFSNFL